MSTVSHLVGTGLVSGVQVVAVVLGGPVLVGTMRKVRCRLEGRVGPPVLQPLIDLRKLFRKQRMRPNQATWIFPLAPVVLVATVAVAIAITPLVTTQPALSSSSDLFVLVYLLIVGSTVLALAGMDAGTAFGGMGSSRAVTIGALAEPAMLVTILALSIGAHSSNLPAIVQGTLAHPGSVATPQRLFALGALVIVIVAESGRLPVDNPATHLELTMIHEAMVLEYSGPDLALVTAGQSMRLALLLGIFVNLVAPWGLSTSTQSVEVVVGLVALAAKVAFVGITLSVFEVFTAKVRLFRLPELLAGAFVLALLGVVSGLVVR
ncbi:MAG TPA: NADH-quinone oxidoreductase subunit H [Acidimicrobiales bacterium]|nr:NADH-quinone oxidoreductase subunit H [Acidimicrobiales bacterium]